MGNDKLYVEFYDTMVEKCDLEGIDKVAKKYSNLTTISPKACWYDNIKLPQTITYVGKKDDTKTFDLAAKDYFKAAIKIDASKVTDKAAKKKKSDYYVDGLLNNGGPATDVFLKAIGKEKTTKLFKEVLF